MQKFTSIAVFCETASIGALAADVIRDQSGFSSAWSFKVHRVADGGRPSGLSRFECGRC